jgi:hypothetical protein
MAEDKKQIGLTSAGDSALDYLMTAGLFSTQMDAYRFGITYAIGRGLEVDWAVQGFGTKFNAAGGVDADSRIARLLKTLGVGDTERPYATAERLADAGLQALERRHKAGENLADVLDSLGEADKPDA